MKKEKVYVRKDKDGKGINGYTECGNKIYFFYDIPTRWENTICPKCGKKMTVDLKYYE